MATTYWCEHAWTGANGLVSGLAVDVEGTHITSTTTATMPPRGAIVLPGLTIPGFANIHSHAFHRALRGRTHAGRGTFWSWRDLMYAVAARLDPDSYYALALAAYQEMVLTGITAVGEFHYLHHQTDGTPYAEPNIMGEAVVSAARDAGLRIALLDTCYLSSGFGAEPSGVQVRFSDRSADRWGSRVAALDTAGDAGVVIGGAIHSVRAVPAEQFDAVAGARPAAPLHVHLSEQVAENEACLAHYGRTPTALLARHGALGPRTTLVHATHLSDDDIAAIGAAKAYAGFCPTTERDLADGIGPSVALAASGTTLTLGTDSHAVVDMFEEMRALELDNRLATMRRGSWQASELLTAATLSGHVSLGFPDAGAIVAGRWADLVTVDMSSIRTAGSGASEQTAVFAATAADVLSVVASGQRISLDRPTVARRLESSINAVIS